MAHLGSSTTSDAPRLRALRHCRVYVAGLFVAAALATAPSAQEGILKDARVFDLPMTAERLYPAGRDFILATDAEAAVLVDARDGRVAGELAVDGRLRAAAVLAAQGSGDPATVALIVEAAPGRLVLRRVLADADRGFGPGDVPEIDLPLPMADPAIAFLPVDPGGYAQSALVVWDRGLERRESAYVFVWDAKAQPVGTKDPPAEMIPIGSSDWMLGLHPDASRASVLEVLSGSRDDNVLVEGLRADQPEALDTFVPDILSGGTGDALVANGTTRHLLALTAREGTPPLLDPPILIALDALPADSAGRLRPWVAADRALSVILVGAAGTDSVQVMRRLRGGVVSLGGMSLGLPVAEAMTLHGAPVGSERFVFLTADRRSIAVVEAAVFESAATDDADPSGAESPETGPVILDPADNAQIQRVLASSGYPVGAIDGRIGPRTEAALRAFQFDNGLEVTGLIDEPTLDRLNAAVGDIGEGTPQETAVTDYADFLAQVAGAGDLAVRVMTLGISEENPDHPCFGLNEMPPRELWPNSVKFVALLRRLEAEVGLGVQVVNGYRSPASARCLEGEQRRGHETFAAFDIRLAAGGASSDGNLRLLSALERLAQGGLTTFEAEPMETTIHVKPLLGQWHALIASYSADARGCGFARDDVDEFAELLAGSDLRGREILVLRTRTSGHYAVTIDLNSDVAAARTASTLIRKVSALSRDRATGRDSFVQQNSDWVLDTDCAHVRVIR